MNDTIKENNKYRIVLRSTSGKRTSWTFESDELLSKDIKRLKDFFDSEYARTFPIQYNKEYVMEVFEKFDDNNGGADIWKKVDIYTPKQDYEENTGTLEGVDQNEVEKTVKEIAISNSDQQKMITLIMEWIETARVEEYKRSEKAKQEIISSYESQIETLNRQINNIESHQDEGSNHLRDRLFELENLLRTANEKIEAKEVKIQEQIEERHQAISDLKVQHQQELINQQNELQELHNSSEYELEQEKRELENKVRELQHELQMKEITDKFDKRVREIDEDKSSRLDGFLEEQNNIKQKIFEGVGNLLNNPEVINMGLGLLRKFKGGSFQEAEAEPHLRYAPTKPPEPQPEPEPTIRPTDDISLELIAKLMEYWNLSKSEDEIKAKLEEMHVDLEKIKLIHVETLVREITESEVSRDQIVNALNECMIYEREGENE